MLKPKGRYYELPLAGSKIRSIVYSGTLRLIFGESGESYLNLLGMFEVKRHGHAAFLLPKSKEALLLFFDLLNAEVAVQEAKADKEGRLFLTFADKTEVIAAGPNEYWDFTRHSSQAPGANGSVSGGLGYLDF
jgi:hypothetical protein